MKLKFLIILLFFIISASFAQAQRIDHSVLSLRQAVGPVLDLRINNSFRDKYYEHAAYFNNINFVIKQDYSNPDKYLVSLVSGLWGLEYGLNNLLTNTASAAWNDWTDFALIGSGFLHSSKFDIYWAHLGWNNDYYIYNKKLIWVFSFNIGRNMNLKTWSCLFHLGWSSA